MVARSMEEESSMGEAKAVAKAVVEKTMKAATTEPRAYVHQSLSEFHLHSNLKRRADVPAITLSDLVVKDKLGAGGFALVTAVEMNGQQYAMKALKPSTVEMKDKRKFAIAASDLWKEAEFLASLHHPHIVDIHGMHMEEDSLDTNFLVLDRLEETLEHKMTAWRAAHVMAKPKARQHLLYERLEVCLDIAQTMQYLHDENVIYRDLKAENLGFDAEGTVKLFGKLMSLSY
jgi:serine/threonine protein kinase